MVFWSPQLAAYIFVFPTQASFIYFTVLFNKCLPISKKNMLLNIFSSIASYFECRCCSRAEKVRTDEPGDSIPVLNRMRVTTTRLSVWPDWAIYWILGNYVKPLATFDLSKSPTFFGNFCKAVKHIIFLVKSFLATFIDVWLFFLVTLSAIQAPQTYLGHESDWNRAMLSP